MLSAPFKFPHKLTAHQLTRFLSKSVRPPANRLTAARCTVTKARAAAALNLATRSKRGGGGEAARAMRGAPEQRRKTDRKVLRSPCLVISDCSSMPIFKSASPPPSTLPCHSAPRVLFLPPFRAAFYRYKSPGAHAPACLPSRHRRAHNRPPIRRFTVSIQRGRSDLSTLGIARYLYAAGACLEDPSHADVNRNNYDS